MRRANKQSEEASQQTSYLIEMILTGTFIEREKKYEKEIQYVLLVFSICSKLKLLLINLRYNLIENKVLNHK